MPVCGVNPWCDILHVFFCKQASDENRGDDEEGQAKVIPKWHATHITQVLIEPEIEEEEEELKVESEQVEETQPEGEAEGGDAAVQPPVEGETAEDGKFSVQHMILREK